MRNHEDIKEVMAKTASDLRAADPDIYQPEPPLTVPTADKSESEDSNTPKSGDTDSSLETPSEEEDGAVDAASHIQWRLAKGKNGRIHVIGDGPTVNIMRCGRTLQWPEVALA